MLHDEYNQLYTQYRVVSAKIKVTPIANTLTGQIPGAYGVFVDANSALDYTQATAAIEDKSRTKSWSMIVGAGQFGQFKNVNRVLTRSYNSKRMGKENQYKTTPFGASPGVDDDTYFQIWAGSMTGADPGTFQFLVELTQTVMLSDPIVVTQS